MGSFKKQFDGKLSKQSPKKMAHRWDIYEYGERESMGASSVLDAIVCRRIFYLSWSLHLTRFISLAFNFVSVVLPSKEVWYKNTYLIFIYCLCLICVWCEANKLRDENEYCVWACERWFPLEWVKKTTKKDEHVYNTTVETMEIPKITTTVPLPTTTSTTTTTTKKTAMMLWWLNLPRREQSSRANNAQNEVESNAT